MTVTFSVVTNPPFEHSIQDRQELLNISFGIHDSISIGRSIDSRRICAVCSRLDLPKPIGPRRTVAPAKVHFARLLHEGFAYQ